MKKNNSEIIYFNSNNNKVRIILDNKKKYKINELLDLVYKEDIDIKKVIYLNNLTIDMCSDCPSKLNDLKVVFYNCKMNEGYIPFYNKEVYIINPIFENGTEIFIENNNELFLIYSNMNYLRINDWNENHKKNKTIIMGNYDMLSLKIYNSNELYISSNAKASLNVNVNKIKFIDSHIFLEDSNIQYKKIEEDNFILQSNEPIIVNNETYYKKNLDNIYTLNNEDLIGKSSLLQARKELIIELKRIEGILSSDINDKIINDYNSYSSKYNDLIRAKEKEILLLKKQINEIQGRKKKKLIKIRKKYENKRIKEIRKD